MGDGIALFDQLLGRTRGAEESVGETAGTGVGLASEQIFGLGVVERVVKPRDRTRGVAKGRMRGDIGDTLAINIDFAAVAQALEIFGTGERPALGADGILAFDPFHEGLSLFAVTPNPRPLNAQVTRRRPRLSHRCGLPTCAPRAGARAALPLQAAAVKNSTG